MLWILFLRHKLRTTNDSIWILSSNCFHSPNNYIFRNTLWYKLNLEFRCRGQRHQIFGPRLYMNEVLRKETSREECQHTQAITTVGCYTKQTFVFWSGDALSSPGCPGTLSNSPASVFQVLVLKVFTTMPRCMEDILKVSVKSAGRDPKTGTVIRGSPCSHFRSPAWRPSGTTVTYVHRAYVHPTHALWLAVQSLWALIGPSYLIL